MTTGSSRAGAILAAFVVGVGVGWVIGSAMTPAPQGTTYSVIVGPRAADVNPPTVTLSRKNGDRVVWTSKEAKTLYIEFTEQPLGGLALQPNRRYRVACQGGTCVSGAISLSAMYGREYKYWQILVDAEGTKDEADGRIIIQK